MEYIKNGAINKITIQKKRGFENQPKGKKMKRTNDQDENNVIPSKKKNQKKFKKKKKKFRINQTKKIKKKC